MELEANDALEASNSDIELEIQDIPIEEEEEKPAYSRCNICRAIADVYRESRLRFSQLYLVFGFKFMLMAILIEWVIQAGLGGGGTGGIIGAPVILLLSEYKLTPARMQILETIAGSAWSLKPISAIFMDSIYIGGYNKIPYIIMTSLMAIAACLSIVIFYPFPSPVLLTIVLFFIFLAISTADLLIESKYVEKFRYFPTLRPKLVSFIAYGSGVFQLASIGLVGILLLSNVAFNYFYIIPMPFFLILLYPAFENWIQDDERIAPNENKQFIVSATGKVVVNNNLNPISKEYRDSIKTRNAPLTNLLYCFCEYRKKESSYAVDSYNSEYEQAIPENQWIPVFGFDRTKIVNHWRMFLLSLIIGLLSVASSLIGSLAFGTITLFAFSLVSWFVMIISFFMLTETAMARMMTYVILSNMFSISLRAATYRFYTDDALAYPEGPHFSNQFYITILGGFAIILNIFGVTIYDTFMAEWKFSKIFLVTGLIYIVCSLPNICLFTRCNVNYLGIPDTVFVLGSEVLQTVVGCWNNMPYSVLILALSKPGTETLCYAIFAGVNNLGNSLSSYQGAFVLDMLHINPTGNQSGESAQFSNLWIASCISIGIQLIPLCCIGFLIPDKKQTDDLYPSIEPSPDESVLNKI
jgi:hypothetical protein